MENEIILDLGTDGWNATWLGECGSDILRLFGTRTVPTAYTVHAKPERVLGDIRHLNPGIPVRLA